MKKIIIKILVVMSLCMFILYIDYPYLHDHIDYFTNNNKDIEVSITINNQVIKKDLDDYLLGVVAGEMPAEFELEALKAQVVASRTFVLSRNLKVDNTTNSQVYLTDKQMKKSWGKDYTKSKSKVQQAIKETHNEVMTYHGQYISALFFSSCNGKTNNVEDYFSGEAVGYLQSVDSKWDLTYDKNNIQKKTFTKTTLAKIFHTTVNNLKIMSYTDSGYVRKMLVNNKEYTGREIRAKLGLASSSFKIKFSKNKYTFITSGSGHGVGMSQYGAQGMAKENKTYKEILHHYYKNIKITSI